MAKNTSDPNSPLAQAEITGTGFWPSSGDSMAPTPPQTSYITTGSKSMPNYPETDQQQTSGLVPNDSQIDNVADSIDGPAEVQWPVPDYAPQNPSIPADVMGTGMNSDMAPDTLTAEETSTGVVVVPKAPPGSIATHVAIVEPSSKPSGHSMGRGEE